MKTFNYSAIRKQKLDSDILGLIAAIYMKVEPLIVIPVFIHDFLRIPHSMTATGRILATSGSDSLMVKMSDRKK